MNNYNEQWNQLMRVHASAKRKLVLGIVFSGAAVFCVAMGSSFIMENEPSVGSVFLFFAFCCAGVGLPFLIIGIIGTKRSNANINRFKINNQMNNNSNLSGGLSYAPQNSYAPQGAPHYASQNSQPYQNQYNMNAQAGAMNVNATSPNGSAKAISAADEIRKYKELLDLGVISQEEFDAKKKQLLEKNVHVDVTPQPQVAPITQPQETPAVQPQQSFVDIDWRKYEPLDAGISYDKSKDYKFVHVDGYCGSVPQKFVDRTFPCCPICCSKNPYWTLGQLVQMSWKGNLYLFKCSHCEGVISMSMPDVQTLRDGASGIISNPNVGLINLAAKASSGKQAGVVYAVIESVGNSGVTRECEGKEFKLEDLQDMFLRR